MLPDVYLLPPFINTYSATEIDFSICLRYSTKIQQRAVGKKKHQIATISEVSYVLCIKCNLRVASSALQKATSPDVEF